MKNRDPQESRPQAGPIALRAAVLAANVTGGMKWLIPATGTAAFVGFAREMAWPIAVVLCFSIAALTGLALVYRKPIGAMIRRVDIEIHHGHSQLVSRVRRRKARGRKQGRRAPRLQ